ncbi:MAG TPA: hypothetical protein VLX91_14440 [Candidatus Acidoferrales bacterium]|nr:hypothetical protein [Candidatus Acidoferrales bacterium]
MKHFSSTSIGNIPPKTYVSAFPYRDSTQSVNFNPQPSSLEIHWWANDPDGLVIGYVITFNKKIWTFTTKTDSVFHLPLYQKDTVYTFTAAAIDNSLKEKLSDGDTVVFASLGNSVDPDPPSIKFPIANTPPTVMFVMNGGQFSTRSDIPDTTFTVASFGWQGNDIDGNNTITNYYIALNDTVSPSSWVELPPQASFVTLEARVSQNSTDTSTVSCDVYANTYANMSYQPLSTPLPNMKLGGNNVFYIKAKDVAGAYSQVARMPDTTHTWFVKKPIGNLLIVNDNSSQDQSLPFYKNIFDSLGLKGKYDVWDIRAGMTPTSPSKGNLVQPYVVPSFQETLKLYKYVFWFTSDERNFDIAQIAVRGFRSNGGKIFFNYFAVNDTNAVDAAGLELHDFTDAIDSISSDILRGAGSNSRPITSKGTVWPGTYVVAIDSTQYPNLVSDNNFFVGELHEIYPVVGANVIYQMQPFGADSAQPVVGVMSGDKSAFVVGVPLYRFNGNSTTSPNTRAYQLIYKVFHDFGAF